MTVLSARHPEIVSSPNFKTWLQGRTLGPWYETPALNGNQTVVLQDPPGEHVFAALVNVKAKVVQHSASLDLTTHKQTRSDLLAIAAKNRIDTQAIHAIRPVVAFRGSGAYKFSWEVEVEKNSMIDTFRFQGPGLKKIFPPGNGFPPNAANWTRQSGKPSDDELADNELHHLAAFQPEALQWVSHSDTTQEKARKIFDKVVETYHYDSTIEQIAEFTWSDVLTRDLNHRGGICDELAVVQITYLRSLKIPARLKLLVGNDDAWAHAVAEYFDDGTWRSMDAVFYAFNDPGYYRRNGVHGITVMDASYPLDSRSEAPAWEIPDITGDGKLNPYDDFVLRPGYPGNAQTGYSFDVPATQNWP